PRGRGWGGSSSINAMIYTRGHARDYDRWQELGCDGWSFGDVLPYFKRAETNENGGDGFHGSSGPLYVSNGRSTNPLFGAFIEAGIQAGYPQTGDFNGSRQEGFGRYQLTIKNGRRCSAATAYLHPALDRPNLTVQSHAHVTRVLLEGTRAIGVEYVCKGELHEVRAVCEVVLSGGAVNTPQVLFLSGIGDRETLNRFDIRAVCGLRGVGRNLQDHLDCSIQYECTQPITLYSQANPLNALRTGLQYVLFGNGIATGQGLEAGGFVKSRSDLETPDLQFHFLAALICDHARRKADRHGFTAHVCHLRPESRGYITLRSADPLDVPLIQPNYLEAEEDRRALREGVKLTREVFSQKAFDPYRGPELMPGADIRRENQIDSFVRDAAETIYHPIGTAKMGKDDDAVVDPQLRVYGIEGLRVVDASIIPAPISGNTNGPTIMIAEKAADLILGKKALSPEIGVPATQEEVGRAAA
ncbi:MAG TPA: choline dehydrogenase, partial [Rhizomicrobium sp.]|nr:choline dehydrogenase [Rhizomicrobium sp.]